MTEPTPQPLSETRHASCVAHKGGAVLILGTSGSGKSALALRLMALGACLIADDRTILTREDDSVTARCPEAIRGMIEARHVGLLGAETLDCAPIRLVVDLDRTEAERLPPNRSIMLLGREIPLLFKVDADHFASAILQHLAHGRKA